MQLTKLEINGFKSFAKKTELFFEEGITGILGPNGCGKSNIADAFRFVLGEQSARALRGKKVEDFIFGGTEKRRPLSFCEVTMYFDNSDGTVASPYTEIAVTRRAFRSGESEYYINKTPCRLKDIQELFRDTGIGKDGYSIIGQGRVGEILSDRSNERRIVFEEAAGVMKYRMRKEEAERKLQNTEKNLERLGDILHELEGRVEPLREQSEKATLYFKMREELRELDLNLFINQYEKSTERIRQLSDTSSQIESELISASTEEEAFAATCAAQESAERRLSTAISDTSQSLITLSSAVESQVGSENLLTERISSARREIAQAEAEKVSLDQTSSLNSDRIGKLRLVLDGYSVDTDSMESELETALSGLQSIENRISDTEKLLEDQKQSMMDAMNRLADTRSRISRLEAMRDSMLSRIDAVRDSKAVLLRESESLSKELSELESAKAIIASDIESINKELNSSKDRSASIELSISDAVNELRKHEIDQNTLTSRKRVLDEMKHAHEGYYASVRRLLNDAARDVGLSSRIHGVVAELISVPKEYERAIEMALGSALQNIIVPTEQDAKHVIEYLRAHDYGRATLLPVSAMRPRLLSSEERSFAKVDGSFGVASELIGYSPAFKNVIDNLLGRTVIVRDIDTGIKINKRAKSSFRIATLDGDILNPGGSMTGGSIQKREFSLLGRDREIEEIAGRITEINAASKEVRSTIEKLQLKLNEQRRETAGYSEKLQKLLVELASNNEKADITLKYVNKNTESLKELDQEIEQLQDSVSEIDSQCSSASEQANVINKGNDVTNDDIRETQLKLNEMRQALQTANEETASIRVRLMAATKEKGSAESELVRLEKENSSIDERTVQLTGLINEKRSDIEGFELQLNELDSAVSVDRDRAAKLNDELREMESERAHHLRLLDEARERREQIRIQIGELKDRLHRIELNSNKLRIDLANMSDRIWQDYEITYENAQSFRRQMPVTQMHLRADELRANIKELGEVNTSAIEDYRSVKERFDDLSAQCIDLTKAKADLDELIGKLTEIMKREFSLHFEKIRENFSETFRELFGGGRAELVLADRSDVLNSNIDIIAQPPGKKLQLLSLLSGGEQALTAIALLFAILKLKPAAFCILDEIDTSLDEANVDCFADYLKGYAAGTQFIIITHRKGAMAVCNSLYGVSMEEKGVSTIVSAKFD